MVERESGDSCAHSMHVKVGLDLKVELSTTEQHPEFEWTIYDKGEDGRHVYRIGLDTMYISATLYYMLGGECWTGGVRSARVLEQP